MHKFSSGEGAHQKSPVSAQATARGAARCAPQVIDRDAKAFARGAAHSESQVLDSSAQAIARGYTCCASQVLDRGAQADMPTAPRR